MYVFIYDDIHPRVLPVPFLKTNTYLGEFLHFSRSPIQRPKPWVSPTQKEIPEAKEIWKRRFLLSKNFPTYPWNIPLEPRTNSLWFGIPWIWEGWGGLGYAPGVCWGSLRYCWWKKYQTTTFSMNFQPFFFHQLMQDVWTINSSGNPSFFGVHVSFRGCDTVFWVDQFDINGHYLPN